LEVDFEKTPNEILRSVGRQLIQEVEGLLGVVLMITWLKRNKWMEAS